MSTCKDCEKSFASRQSLCNHRKRMHPGNTVKVGSGLPQTLKSLTQVQKVPKVQGTKGTKGTKEVKKILDIILSPSKNVQTVQDISPPKVAKTEEDLSTDEESDSDTEDSMSKGKKDQNSKLIDYFQKLYAHFDEDDVELCNDILNLLEELKTRGCITESEYTHIKSILGRQIHLNMQETINSTVENMTRDDKNEILGLLRSMKNDEGVEKLSSSLSW